jgi:DNA-binding NtrC family response regulator
VDAGDQPRFVAQHRAVIGVVRIAQALDRDQPREPALRGERTEVDRGHATRRQGVEQPIATDASVHAGRIPYDAAMVHDEPSTVSLHRLVLSPSPEAAYVVGVDRGPDLGRSVTVDGASASELIVGTSPACDLRLTDPAVSRRHIALDVVGAALRVRDLGSKNGTVVGTLRIGDARLEGGESIAIGSTTLRVSRSPAVAAALPVSDRFGDVLGASREMRRLFPLLERLANASIPVLVEGETGVGKEAVANAMHRAGPRRDRPFVICDCTAIAPNLVESELFGHEKGAFTGATQQRTGVFEQADGGTLFVDELGELSLELQAKLLRAIDTGDVCRVGGQRRIRCDVRIIAATRRDLDAMVQAGTFRDDLFHRLAVGRVSVPPLRERRGDIPLLVEHFCRELGVDTSALGRSRVDAWIAHPWPGNVRELRNAIARWAALGELDAAPAPVASPVSGAGALDQLLERLLPYDEARQRAIEIFQRLYVASMMQATNGNVQRAATMAGVALRYFQLLRARHRDPDDHGR